MTLDRPELFLWVREETRKYFCSALNCEEWRAAHGMLLGGGSSDVLLGFLVLVFMV